MNPYESYNKDMRKILIRGIAALVWNGVCCILLIIILRKKFLVSDIIACCTSILLCATASVLISISVSRKFEERSKKLRRDRIDSIFPPN